MTAYSTCTHCGKGFEVAFESQKYCDSVCRKRAKSSRQRQQKANLQNPSQLDPGDRGDQKLIQRALTDWPRQALPVLPLTLVDDFARLATTVGVKARVAQGAAKVAIAAYRAIHQTTLEREKLELVKQSGIPQEPLFSPAVLHEYLDTATAPEPVASDHSQDSIEGEVETSPPPDAHQQVLDPGGSGPAP